ncbi:Uncharacterized protein PECH_006023 [Penicillium ucsense]|uniref:Polarized growth protein Boi2 n=1 Tax=Penicillium ucsense TaxID=2839758 RepID=A0A8J8W2G3_9EURO|nr:Uncharacterized protein PECM_007472 [Penicillium ucsense]KAF7735880.1 Uncharacterized protein PECH_006023 [Penicillium ucsense]
MAANAPATPAPPLNVQRGDYLLVLHEHTPRGDDELRMKRGDVILLEEMDEEFQDGWWLGEHPGTGQKGLFPAGFTRKAQPHQIPTSYRLPSSLEHIQTDLESHATAPDSLDVTNQEPSTPVDTSFSAVSSEQSTPQASRPGTAAEMTSSPQDYLQQQRSVSSPVQRPGSLAANIQEAFRRSIDSHATGDDSPVMNETLSVIDEHITDMNTPRHSVSTQEVRTANDSASEYSSHLSHRMSYINGNETDEEENTRLTPEEVRRWNPSETAKHLRELDVDHSHCEIFEREEITGDVLLEMDQDTIFMKHFDLGVMGKRLKTWHKIKAFQEEVKGISTPQSESTRGSISSHAGSVGAARPEERSLSRAGQTNSFLPRIPTLSERSGPAYGPRIATMPGHFPRLASNGNSPLTTTSPQFTQFSSESPRRVSAASIRDYNRRHSSIDATNRAMSEFHSNNGHQKKPSFDRTWTLNNGAPQPLPARPGTAAATGPGYRGPKALEAGPDATARLDELERGYFSGTEVDSRRSRRLQKRTSNGGSITHSRKSSLIDESNRVNAAKRRSRVNSVDSIRDVASRSSPSAPPYHGTPPKSRFRSMSTRVSSRSGNDSQSSTRESKPGFFASFGPLIRNKNESKGDNKSAVSGVTGDNKNDSSVRASTATSQSARVGNAEPASLRTAGTRTISEVISKGGSDNSAPVSPRDYDPMSGRTGSTTPSGTSKSSERHSTDESGKAAEGAGSVARPRVAKTKKETSAYTRGLEKKSPQEQVAGCDYSGWMKKRSSNLMATWKPRLFVLRGRRLSYYYSEKDTEERGLIDITAHRVLRADNDPIIALHATVTGSTAMPANANALDPGAKAKALNPALSGKDSSGPFFFKLVPPKSGNARTVQFTKPTTHYFQVDTVQEGRLWMAALMKATIERDLSGKVETSNKQKTISLKQARMMQARPPALMNLPADAGQSSQVPEHDAEDQGLRINGLNLNKVTAGGSDTPHNNEADGDSADQPTPSASSASNPLGEIRIGTSPLLPDALVQSDAKQG